MKRQIEQVREFNEAFNVPMNKKPNHIPFERVDLRNRLMSEEVREYFVAAKIKGDIGHIGQELIDTLYVTIGAMLEHGFNAELITQMFDEVHRANMSKIEGGTIREDGKIIKPDNFIPPRIGVLLREYEKNN